MKFLRNLVENVTLRKMVDPQEALHLVSKSPSSKVSNRPFPSSLVPLFQNESKCETFCFETEAQGNSEMAYLFLPTKISYGPNSINIFFNIDQTIFLCAIYIPRWGSPYFNSDIFTDLEKDITKFSAEGLIMLTGDLNARTGSALDFVDSDHCIHVPGINLPQKHNLRRRKNYDSQINEHGKSLLEICKTCDLRIVNGRTSADSFGRITCHSPKGISTVDYFNVSHEMLR